MLFLAEVGLLVLFGFCLLRFRDLLHPTILFLAPWVVFLGLLPMSDFSKHVNYGSLSYLIILVGAIVFIVGTLLGGGRVGPDERLRAPKHIVALSGSVVWFLTILELVFTVALLMSIADVVSNNYTTNIFLSYHGHREEQSGGTFFGYGRYFFCAFNLCFLVLYFCASEERKRSLRTCLFLQILLYILLSLSKFSRNGILQLALPMVFLCLLLFRMKNKDLVKCFAVLAVAILVLFSAVSAAKYAGAFSSGDFLSNVVDSFVGYGSGGLLAFQEHVDSGNYGFQAGQNTFRTVVAVFDDLLGTEDAPALIQPFVSFGDDLTTNVYTFYQWYLDDFGILYCLGMQFLLGFLYGFLYSGASRGGRFSVYAYALLTYPLLVQFFQDQYFSLLSLWIQFALYGVLFLKTGILAKLSLSDKTRGPERGERLWQTRGRW